MARETKEPKASGLKRPTARREKIIDRHILVKEWHRLDMDLAKRLMAFEKETGVFVNLIQMDKNNVAKKGEEPRYHIKIRTNITIEHLKYW